MIETHLASLTLAGYRPATVDVRRRVLVAFDEQVGLAGATHQATMMWLARPLAAETRRAYRSHLRGFYAWAVEEGFLIHNPVERVPSIRVHKGVPRPIAPDDLSLALSRADVRMRAWLLLMAYAGLRCLEVAGLRPSDLLLDPRPLLYLRETKGGGSATVPAHPVVVEALAEMPVSGGLWWEVSARSVSQQVNVFLHERCGIASTAHSLRHFAGTSWYRASGHDLLTTAALLRHQHVNSTQIYAALDPARPADVVRLVEPLVLT